MIALTVLGSILLFFVLLLSLPITLTLTYRESVELRVKLLFFRVLRIPRGQRKRGPRSMSAKKAKRIQEKRSQKQQKKADAAKQKRQAKEAKKKAKKAKKKKERMPEILDLLRLITELIGVVVKKLLKSVRIHLKRLKVTVATEDAASTAVAYGAVTGILSTLLPLIQSVKHVTFPREKDLAVDIDFLSDSPSMDLELSLTLRVGHILGLAIGALVTFVKHKLKVDQKKAARSAPAAKKPQGSN